MNLINAAFFSTSSVHARERVLCALFARIRIAPTSYTARWTKEDGVPSGDTL